MTTYDVTTFSEATDLFMSVLMFIGASPSSVGGGIRTTTFAIIILFLIAYSRGQSDIQVFKREIHIIDVFRSFAVLILLEALFLQIPFLVNGLLSMTQYSGHVMLTHLF